MDTNKENTELFEDESTQETATELNTTDELKEAVEETLSKIRNQSLLLGAQTICQTIVNKIYAFEAASGKKSANDYKRCIKDIKAFCETGLSRKVNFDGTTEPVEQTDAVTEQN